MAKQQTGAEIVAEMMARAPLTSAARQRSVAAQYAVLFGTDRPSKAQAAALVCAYEGRHGART